MPPSGVPSDQTIRTAIYRVIAYTGRPEPQARRTLSPDLLL